MSWQNESDSLVGVHYSPLRRVVMTTVPCERVTMLSCTHPPVNTRIFSTQRFFFAHFEESRRGKTHSYDHTSLFAQHNNHSLGFGTLTHVLGVLSIALSQFAIGWWLMIDASVAHEVKG